MSRLLLHIGTHKTATTTVQRFLRRNDSALAKRGTWYPHYRLVGRAPHHAHLAAMTGLAGRDAGFDRETARRFFREVRTRLPRHERTILSAESAWRLTAGPSDAPAPTEPEAYWAARRAYIAALREALGPARVVVVLRRPDAYAASLYAEHVKATRYTGDFAAFRRDFWWHFDYLGQLRAWARAFPDPVVLSFSELVAEGDPAGAFCAALGIDAEGLPRPAPQNARLPADLTVLRRGLNATDRPRASLRARIEALEAALDAPLRDRLAGRSLWASAAEAEAFRAKWSGQEPELLAEFTGGRPLWDDAPADPEALHGDALDPALLDWLTARAAAPAGAWTDGG